MTIVVEEYSQNKHLIMLSDFTRRMSWVSSAEVGLSPFSGLTKDLHAGVHHCILNSSETMVVTQGGRLMALGGYGLSYMADGTPLASPWLLTTKDLALDIGLLRKLKALLELWVMRNPGVHWANRAFVDHKPTRRWLKFFGFTLGHEHYPWIDFYLKK